MPFADLETMELDDYLAREAQTESLWYFLHIPKTAGSSFSSELAARMRPYRNVHVDYTRTDLTAEAQMPERVSAFVREMEERRFKSASGHTSWDQLEPLRRAPFSSRFVTFLRSPEARVISDYRYQRTEMHPPHAAFIREFPTLESYVENRVSQNKMARYLMGRKMRDITPEDLIAHIGQAFTFIGLVEMYPLSFTSIFTAMGHPKVAPVEHKRKTPDTASTEVALTPALKARIRDVNALDQAAFDHVRAVLMRHRDLRKEARKA